MKIKAGAVLVFSHGEYSDYSFTGPFRVLKDFDQAEVSETFTDEWRLTPHEEWEDSPQESGFIAWMNKNGYVEDLPSHQWQIGSYGFSPEIQDEPTPPVAGSGAECEDCAGLGSIPTADFGEGVCPQCDGTGVAGSGAEG